MVDDSLCWWCGEEVNPGDSVEVELYDSPFDTAPRVLTVHTQCADQLTDSYYTSFWYCYCSWCGRLICYRNPSNGWHEHFRIVVDEYVCLRCYEERILADGQPEEDFEGDGIHGGMFFSYGNPEPLEQGYIEVTTMFIGGPTHARKYNELARKLIAEGNQVITCYERLAIGGLEGTVTMMYKPREEPTCEH